MGLSAINHHRLNPERLQPESAAVARQGAPQRQSRIDAHLELLAAPAASGDESADRGIAGPSLDAAPRPPAAEEEQLSGVQVLVAYLSQSLSTPLAWPRQQGPELCAASAGSTGASTLEAAPRRTWDNLILPDRPGSFVNLYA